MESMTRIKSSICKSVFELLKAELLTNCAISRLFDIVFKSLFPQCDNPFLNR